MDRACSQLLAERASVRVRGDPPTLRGWKGPELLRARRKAGARGGTRTPDQRLMSPLLYQLSYPGKRQKPPAISAAAWFGSDRRQPRHGEPAEENLSSGLSGRKRGVRPVPPAVVFVNCQLVGIKAGWV